MREAIRVSELFKGIVDKAKETLNPIVDKAKDMVESGELKEKAGGALEFAREKAGQLKDSAASGELKDKAAGVISDVKEKAAPVLDKVKDAAGDVADKVKDAATTVMSGEKPALDVKNELFNELGKEVAENRDAIQEQAAAMQAKIEEMLGGGKKE